MKNFSLFLFLAVAFSLFVWAAWSLQEGEEKVNDTSERTFFPSQKRGGEEEKRDAFYPYEKEEKEKREKKKSSSKREVDEKKTSPPEKVSQQKGEKETKKATPNLEKREKRYSPPSPEAVEKLQVYSREKNREGLWELFLKEKSPLRYEALRRYLALGPSSLLPLTNLLKSESDPALHSMIGAYLADEGSAQVAENLIQVLPQISSDSGRLAAASALLQISRRKESISSEKALSLLEKLAHRPSFAQKAIQALSEGGPQSVPVLKKLIERKEVAEKNRFQAAEVLYKRDPQMARPYLEFLLQELESRKIKRAIRHYLDKN